VIQVAKVIVTCKSCDREFPSPVQVASKESFDTMGFADNTIQCPVCGQANVYNKPDLKFVK